MFSDDKNEITNDVPQFDDDLVLNDDNIPINIDDDGIVSIKNESVIPESKLQSGSASAIQDDDISSIEFNTDTSSDTGVDDIDEDELRKILAGDVSTDGQPNVVDHYSQDADDADDLNQILSDSASDDGDIVSRKDELKNTQSVSPVLLALLFGLVVAAVIYFIFNFMANKEDDSEPSMNFNPPQQAVNDQENVNQDDKQEGAIPVVNEDEASELKPDEEEEKKEVVNVIPTGRPNPFLPLSKYTVQPRKTETVVRTINNIDYDSVNIPLPPKEYGEISTYTDQLMTISVSGIMYDKVKPSAIITYDGSDYFVQIGDRLNKFHVADIGPDYVKIALGKNIYTAKVGEEFKVNDFYGNVQYKNGKRQYYSSEAEFEARADDITIKAR